VERESVYVNEPIHRRSGGKRKVAVYLGLAVLLAAASLVAVNAAGSSTRPLSPQGTDKTGSVVPQSVGCAKTFTNTGPPAMTACVSSHGNIDTLSYGPFGGPVDHIVSEGYCLREANTSLTYYDAGGVETGWGVATQSSTATTTTVTRTTTDGVFTLTQNIFFKYGSRLVLIGNLVKNNDTVGHGVFFTRYADIDMESLSGSDVFDTAGASVFAQESNGVALTSLGNPALLWNFGADTFANWSASGRSSCVGGALITGPTAPGDYVAEMQHVTNISPGATVNFRVGYRLL
jgi:hypothetical protein